MKSKIDKEYSKSIKRLNDASKVFATSFNNCLASLFEGIKDAGDKDEK